MPDPGSSSSIPPTRRVRLLGNGRYSVMLTDAGTGYSHWRQLAITRWREDPTCDDWGSFVVLRDVDGGDPWSPTRQPLGADAPAEDDAFEDGRAVFRGERGGLSATLEVAVSGDCDGEVRRVVLRNRGDTAREIELTSYAELVLGPAGADASHPAFSKMFVQTHWEPDGEVLLATRRKRSPDDDDIWAAHCMVVDSPRDVDGGDVEYETDRARFLGRGHRLAGADALQPGARLSDTVGTVLDPVFSLRRRVRVASGASVRVDVWTLAAGSRADALAAARKAGNPDVATRAIASAAGHATGAADGDDFGPLLAPLLYADAGWRAPADALARGSGGMPVLWAHGISGDRPIVLLRIANPDGCRAAESLLRAQRQWRRCWFGVDLVLLAATGGDADAVHARLQSLAQAQSAAIEADGEGAKAEAFVLREDDCDAGILDGLRTVARVVLEATSTGWRPVAAVGKDGKADSAASSVVARKSQPIVEGRPSAAAHDASPVDEATPEFFNGLGGFVGDGREYRIVLDGDACTPMPWINVVANPEFGFIATAEGGGYTWSGGNSQQNPLTPWPNDPVSDTPGEVIYLRDDDSGALWSATPSPIRVPGSRHVVTHGKGWSRFAHRAHDIEVELLQCVPVSDTIKLSRLRLRNRSGRRRSLSVTGYVRWALAPNGSNAAPWIVTERDGDTGALFARNRWRAEFGGRVAFIDMGGVQTACSGDRSAFLGRFGVPDAPAALQDGKPLDGRVGAGLDPCGALQTSVTLEADHEVELVFALGDAPSDDEARALVCRYRETGFDAVLAETSGLWDGILDTVQVRTPDRALDILLNDWLLYQSLGCRIWGRSAYYQSSGAYGFRDQLQDVMSICVARPDLAREHIVRSAGRQFPEGDVQHWWLPPSGQGIRTRMVDDRVWLAFVAAHYIQATGDAAVLDEDVPFIEGPSLEDKQHEAFFKPETSQQTASVYEHAARAIDVSLELGPHGLPLIGTGDWNDGMNRVGQDGKGESVWMAWLLLATIDAFAPFAEARSDDKRLARWRELAATLRKNVEDTGWDGDWYRRGYYDDGTPLGSAQSLECRIDTIAQSWSAIAGANDAAHVASAMDAVHERLLHPDDGVALLFTPPFDDGPTDPGYIKGYPPGLRENGGQYTHGAIWSVFAFAKLGQGDRAGALFDLLNPIHHADAPEKVDLYKVEPYVACADVYSVAPHVGRGGWTWYTGSAGWLYRAGLEAILGFRVEAGTLLLEPCIPQAWDGFHIRYRHRSARYEIEVRNPQHVQTGVVAATLDDKPVPVDPCRIALADDGGEHRIVVTLGSGG